MKVLYSRFLRGPHHGGGVRSSIPKANGICAKVNDPWRSEPEIPSCDVACRTAARHFGNWRGEQATP